MDSTPRRIVVVGTSGAGKTTLASELAHLLNVPHIELDAYRHGPNWTETPDDIFRQKISDSLTGRDWVVDGNYSVARDIVWTRATTVVWLDYSFHVAFSRLFRRTMSRYVKRTELWNGNREDLEGRPLRQRLPVRMGVQEALEPQEILPARLRPARVRSPGGTAVPFAPRRQAMAEFTQSHGDLIADG